MSLLWHIVRKDLRRVRWAVALWLGFVLVSAIWVFVGKLSIPANVDAWPYVAATLRLHWSLGEIFSVLQIVIGGILAASVVQEDSPVGTSSFWQTRPIAGTRLLAAKIVSAIALAIIAPVIVLLPVWLVAGFSTIEIANVSWDWTRSQGMLLWLALVVAALTANLGKFLMLALGAGYVVAFALLRRMPFRWLPDWMFVQASRETIVISLCVMGGVGVLGLLYFWRRTEAAWAFLRVVLVLMVAVRLGWMWPLASVGGVAGSAPVAEIAVKGIRLQPDGKTFLTITQQRPSERSHWVVRYPSGELRWDDGTKTKVWFATEETAFTDVARRIAGRTAERGEEEYQMELHLPEAARKKLQTEAAVFSGHVILLRIEGSVLGEMAVQKNNSIRNGASRTRIAELTVREGAVAAVIEERDAAGNWGTAGDERNRVIDVYLWMNRARDDVRVLPVNSAGVSSGGLFFGAWPVGFDAITPEELRTTIMTKVRMEQKERRGHSFEPVRIGPIKEEKP